MGNTWSNYTVSGKWDSSKHLSPKRQCAIRKYCRLTSGEELLWASHLRLLKNSSKVWSFSFCFVLFPCIHWCTRSRCWDWILKRVMTLLWVVAYRWGRGGFVWERKEKKIGHKRISVNNLVVTLEKKKNKPQTTKSHREPLETWRSHEEQAVLTDCKYSKCINTFMLICHFCTAISLWLLLPGLQWFSSIAEALPSSSWDHISLFLPF